MAVFIAFAVCFAAGLLAFRVKGEPWPDCIHKGAVSGVVGALAFLIVATVASYV